MNCGMTSIYKIIGWLSTEPMEQFISHFIASKAVPWGSLFPKMWIVLLSFFQEVILLHETEELFVNLQPYQMPLMEEYLFWLKAFEKSGGINQIQKISLDSLLQKIQENYHIIVPLEKVIWKKHFVNVFGYIQNMVYVFDNELWEYSLSQDTFFSYLSSHNGRYVLMCK